ERQFATVQVVVRGQDVARLRSALGLKDRQQSLGYLRTDDACEARIHPAFEIPHELVAPPRIRPAAAAIDHREDRPEAMSPSWRDEPGQTLLMLCRSPASSR